MCATLYSGSDTQTENIMSDQLITKTSYGYRIANLGMLFEGETEWVLLTNGNKEHHFQDFATASAYICNRMGWNL
jgi:hypothetical protein